MPRQSSYRSFAVNEKDKIIDFVDKFSPIMSKYVKAQTNSEFYLFYKYITHSDLVGSGKATQPNRLRDNLLYYIDENEMAQIEQTTRKPFQTAHQSNIGLCAEFYEKIGIPNPREVDSGNGTHQYLINDYINVYLEKNNLKYFVSKYTTKVFDKLNKTYDPRKWSSDAIDVIDSLENSNNLNGIFEFNFDNGFDGATVEHINLNDNLVNLQLHCAVHGIGMEIDSEFHKLRHNLFKGDVLVFLCEIKNNERNNLFILFDKNPVFYNLIGETNLSYLRYQETIRRRDIANATSAEIDVDDLDEVTRSLQSSWREMLAKEMMSYTQFDRQVMCPFTYIQADYDGLGTLYRASHIKGFKDPNTTNEEKYDINNGLLLCSNADALFDKHLITVGEDKELVFSYLIEQNPILKQQLLLTVPIFKAVLNNERMRYLEYHRNVFYQLEAQRRAQ